MLPDGELTMIAAKLEVCPPPKPYTRRSIALPIATIKRNYKATGAGVVFNGSIASTVSRAKEQWGEVYRLHLPRYLLLLRGLVNPWAMANRTIKPRMYGHSA